MTTTGGWIPHWWHPPDHWLTAGLPYYSYHAYRQGSAFDAHLPFCDGLEDETAMATMGRRVKGLGGFGGWGMGVFFSSLSRLWSVSKCFQHGAILPMSIWTSSNPLPFSNPKRHAGCSSPRLCIRWNRSFGPWSCWCFAAVGVRGWIEFWFVDIYNILSIRNQ